MFYGSKLLFQGGGAQGVNLLAQKSNVGVIKEGFGWFDGDVILEKDIEEKAQLLK